MTLKKKTFVEGEEILIYDEAVIYKRGDDLTDILDQRYRDYCIAALLSR